ncbi:LysE family translocator [Leptolyngbya sp. NK1-12]|uniref:LysE family translocator n=1 Tax=Leptolyngbya sp. NK1-12 TaxID=2547451 RepID=A0AA96WG49_9CYAN|nr:LysE family translocator [Leptolyngbya sp. NK1-12]WNZ24598.1 LysE family translocator [Leptolyngbya sp. NK1-12]
MPNFAAFSLFLTAAFILSITPGPGMLYVLTRSLHGGRQEGLVSALGTFIGGFFHVLAAAIGLSAVLMASAVAFSVVKYAGAAYLIYLGMRMLLSRRELLHSINSRGSGNQRALYQGIVTEILNPKTGLFFLAFIPQFVDPSSNTLLQFLLLGLITISFNFTVDVIVAAFAGPLGSYFQSHRRFRQRQRTFSGCSMIGLGAYVALAEQK